MHQKNSLLTIIGLIFIIFLYENVYVVDIISNSMIPILKKGKKAIYVNRKFFKLRKGAIIIFEKNGQLLVKRIVGLSNDTVSYSSQKLILNEVPINEDYLKNNLDYCFISPFNSDYIYVNEYIVPFEGYYVEINPESLARYKQLIEDIEQTKITQKGNRFFLRNSPFQNYIFPTDCYYVLGDNRNNSIDSRSYGAISEKNIRGVVIF